MMCPIRNDLCVTDDTLPVSSCHPPASSLSLTGLLTARGTSMQTKLTPAFIAKAAAPGKHQVVYWDAAMPGFGVMVTVTGHKSFVFQYRANGKSRRATIKFGIGLEAARREAKAIQGAVARGGDPVGEKKAE